MAEIHYNILSLRTQMSKEAEEVPETNSYQCNMKNIIQGCHVQFTRTLAPLQHLSTSYDMGTRPCILQRWIKATIYNDESSKSGSCVGEHNKILRNLGYRWKPKVFVKIQKNQYNPGHVNICVEVEHGKDSTDCQSIGENWQLKQRNSPMMIVNPKVPSSKLQVFIFRKC